MTDSPKVASRLMRKRAVFAVSDEVQFTPNDTKERLAPGGNTHMPSD